MNRTSTPNRQAWFIIFGAMSMLPLVYMALAYNIEGTRRPIIEPNLPTLRLLFGIVAVAVLSASILWAHFKTLGKMGASGETLMSPQQFQTDSIVALAFAEACSSFGLCLFFLGDTSRNFAPFALGTLAVCFAFILPKGIRYWTAWELAQQPRGPSPYEDLK